MSASAYARPILIRFDLVGWATLAGALLTFGPRTAAAFPSSRLVYSRGPGTEACPDQAAVRDAVKQRLGYDPFFPTSDKTIVARVVREAEHLRGEVELVDEHGTQLGLREFSARADECEQLIHAMALSISIAIDPKSAETYAQGPIDEAPPEAQEKPAESPISPAPPPPTTDHGALHAAQPVASAALGWSLGLGPMASLGPQPTLTLGAIGFGAARYRWLSLALEGELDLPRTTREAAVELRTSSWALRFVPCMHAGVGFACPVVALRSLSATGTESNVSGSARSLSVGGRLGAELPLGRALSALAYAELLGNAAPPRLLSGGRELWRAPPVSGALGFALSVHFP